MFTLIKQLKEKIIANKSSLIKIAIFLGIYLLFSEFSFADNAGPTAQETQEKIKSNLITFFSWTATIISTFLGLMTYLTTLFLSPEWTSGNIFGMVDYFKEIWIFVANIVYFAFAFILIAIAFANILGIGGNFELKQALPKFIVGILIVPFSWFIVNFVVSLSSVLTLGSLNLPFEVFKNYESKLGSVNIHKECTINLSALGKSEGQNGKDKIGAENNSIYECNKEKGTITLNELLNSGKSSDGIFGVISLYTYGILNIESIQKINQIDLNTIKTIGDVLVKIVFDLLFVIVYGLLMIALGLTLMIRGIWLWIYIMLSPLFGLLYFFGKANGGGGGKFFENFNFKEFLSLAMVPVYSMLALSFGLLFIWIVGEGMSSKVDDSLDVQVKDNTLNIGKFSLNIKGTGASLKDVPGFLDRAGSSALGVIGILILKIFGIVVLWGTLMAAMRSSNITKTIVEPIASFGEGIGKAVTSLPQYTPILPGGQSLKSLGNAGQNLDGALQRYFGVNERSQNLLNSLGIEKGEIRGLLDELKTTNGKNNPNDQDFNKKWLDSVLRAVQIKGNAVYNDADFKEMLKMKKIDGVTNHNSLATALNELTYNKTGFDKYTGGRDKDSFLKVLGGKPEDSSNISSQENKSNTQNTNQTNNKNVININLANKEIALPNNTNFKLSSDAKTNVEIAKEIKDGLGDNKISKTNLINSLKTALGTQDDNDSRIKAIIDELGDVVTNQ